VPGRDTPEEYERRLRDLVESSSDVRCPLCKSRAWYGLGGGDMPSPMKLPMLIPDEPTNIEYGWPVVGFVCAQCGFVRLHDLGAIHTEPKGPPEAMH
jgi:hypothetical protein